MAAICVNWISYVSESVHQKSIDLSSETAGIRVKTVYSVILIKLKVSLLIVTYSKKKYKNEPAFFQVSPQSSFIIGVEKQIFLLLEDHWYCLLFFEIKYAYYHV